MKKIFLSMFALAALLMTGCSSEEVTPNGGDVTNGNGEAETRYLSVNLMSSDITRAADGYEDGSDIENHVSKVRFYFFDESGDPANVKYKNGGFVNYYDWTPGGSDQVADTDDNDVESLLKATIVINTKDGDKLPQMIAAVLNPTETTVPSRSLSDLKKVVNDYADADLTKKGKFVMFNSVYAVEGAEVCASPILAINLAKTDTEAKAHPVTLYVERNVAKVSVTFGEGVAAATTDKLELKDKSGNAIKVEGQSVYLKINGWKVTAETDKGRLGKRINTEWPSYQWGTHRSFWAINAAEAANRYYEYDNIDADLATSLYTNENALNYTNPNGETNNLNRTKVIFNGTLCKADGTAFTIVRHLGVYLADDPANFNALKKSILSQLSASGKNYYYDSEEIVNGKPVRKQIDVNDLEIVVADQLIKEDSKNNCYVYAQLTKTAEDKTWYNSVDEKASALEGAAATINADLADEKLVDKALVWNSGQTYYYYEIIHRGSGETATKGVVRNHWYKTTVTSIAGLGTPVYDPSITIYPEKPDPNDHYIAAQIRILSWRIVSNNYDLEW